MRSVADRFLPLSHPAHLWPSCLSPLHWQVGQTDASEAAFQRVLELDTPDQPSMSAFKVGGAAARGGSRAFLGRNGVCVPHIALPAAWLTTRGQPPLHTASRSSVSHRAHAFGPCCCCGAQVIAQMRQQKGDHAGCVYILDQGIALRSA